MAVGWVVVALALGAWSVVVAIRYDGRIYRWYVERAGESKGRMVGLVVGLHAASWLGWLLVWAAGAALDRGTGHHEWAGLAVVPALLLYGPWVCAFLPTQYGGVRTAVAQARGLGATRGLARALMWTSAPLALLGLVICFAAYTAAFATR
jgi:hypothetical protein